MRTAIVTVLIFGLALTGCNKGGDEAKGPTQAEVYAKHQAEGAKQVENVRAVVELACSQKVLSNDELTNPAGTLGVTDIVLNRGNDEHTGNARVLLLSEVFTRSDHAKAFGAEDAMRRIRRMDLPTLPTGFHPGSFNEVLTRSAAFLKEAPSKGADKEHHPAHREMLEEFVSLKYLLLLRTIAIKAPQEVEANVYTPGIYAGQLMVFDLSSRTLLGVLPVLTSNKAGEKAAGVDFDLGAEVETLMDELLSSAQGKPAQ